MTELGPASVYVLCFVTSLVCAGLLIRAYLASRGSLLFWTAAGFVFLTLNNLVLVADMVLLADIDLWWLRQTMALCATGVMIYGFIREVR